MVIPPGATTLGTMFQLSYKRHWKAPNGSSTLIWRGDWNDWPNNEPLLRYSLDPHDPSLMCGNAEGEHDKGDPLLPWDITATYRPTFEVLQGMVDQPYVVSREFGSEQFNLPLGYFYKWATSGLPIICSDVRPAFRVTRCKILLTGLRSTYPDFSALLDCVNDAPVTLGPVTYDTGTLLLQGPSEQPQIGPTGLIMYRIQIPIPWMPRGWNNLYDAVAKRWDGVVDKDGNPFYAPADMSHLLDAP